MSVLNRAKDLIFLLARLDRRLDTLLINQGRIMAAQARLRDSHELAEHEFKVFSQWGEDGIIQRLIDLVPINHQTFIEFGVGDFAESNCRYLLMKNNWRGFVIDGSKAKMARLQSSYYYWMYDLNHAVSFINSENINTLLNKSGFDSDLGVLSIDLDGADYWVLSAITTHKPRILSVEYNALFGSERAITVPYDPAFQRHRAHYSNLYFGASLMAFDHWARQNGYALVGTASNGANAFFVRQDLLSDRLPMRDVGEAFAKSRFREGRREDGALTYAAEAERASAIKGMPVVNVVTGQTEIF